MGPVGDKTGGQCLFPSVQAFGVEAFTANAAGTKRYRRGDMYIVYIIYGIIYNIH